MTKQVATRKKEKKGWVDHGWMSERIRWVSKEGQLVSLEGGRVRWQLGVMEEADNNKKGRVGLGQTDSW